MFIKACPVYDSKSRCLLLHLAMKLNRLTGLTVKVDSVNAGAISFLTYWVGF